MDVIRKIIVFLKSRKFFKINKLVVAILIEAPGDFVVVAVVCNEVAKFKKVRFYKQIN